MNCVCVCVCVFVCVWWNYFHSLKNSISYMAQELFPSLSLSLLINTSKSCSLILSAFAVPSHTRAARQKLHHEWRQMRGDRRPADRWDWTWRGSQHSLRVPAEGPQLGFVMQIERTRLYSLVLLVKQLSAQAIVKFSISHLYPLQEMWPNPNLYICIDTFNKFRFLNISWYISKKNRE